MKVNAKSILLAVLSPAIFAMISCGGASFEFDFSVPTQSPPYINRIDPVNASPGDVVIIYGFGFSIVEGNNVISFGGVSTVAEDYAELEATNENEIESLTVTVPDGVDAGENDIKVSVFDNVSNTDLKITITP